ncbi:hypothetical protein [Rhizobium sp. SG741]|uniref:hypothetical protein n=1 Tax=Rhizobium sp. SG741 TaxID=2587114 RepID=UPI0014478BB4|nr:hypothetical protein [Rhizobium sp. SG741]NKJ03794.1 hypothetical protein [Rhizobium sp. SG741]
MIPASYRSSYYETVQELAELSGGAVCCERAMWSVEYIARGAWYQFNGYSGPGEVFSAASSMDPVEGSVTDLDPALLPLILLDFHYNAVIGAYIGTEKLATRIAFDVLRGLDFMPEIVSILIARDEAEECGSLTRTMTRFAYVGFERSEHADDIGSAKCLAPTPDALSA